MKNLGRIEDPKDIITKEFLEGGIGARVNTLEDNLQMAESDIETLQTDVQGLKTDNTATKAAVKTLQDTYVPNTRKVNNKALDADITLNASDVWAITKVSPSTEGNLPILTTSGELTDSGKKISDIGGGVFLVTVTGDEASGYNADKTFIEIKNAYDAGMVVLLKNNALIYHQVTYTPNIFVFSYSDYQRTRTFAILLNNFVRSTNTNFVPDTRTINNKPLSSDITLTASDVGAIPNTTPIPDIKVVTNVSCPLSAWVSDTTTYTDYQFKADLTVAGATADYIPLVNFAPSEQESGNYIGATSGNGIVTIWCKSKPSGTITIPNIILTKEN